MALTVHGPNAATLTNASANSAAFQLQGGRYAFKAFSSGANWNSGSLAIALLGDDGSTYVPANTLSADGTKVVDLPACTARFQVSGSPSGLYASIQLIPFRATV